ncbi:MAG: HsdR family type I site-specific deoxyribonuclease [Anaerolineaceae bacterium]|nr:HsdR family type I site-specific deoxyribonuclease [Anaerolineaceae bacterium]
MSNISKAERVTQNRVIALFRDDLGYAYLGDRSDNENSNIWEDRLRAYLQKSGYSPAKISRAIDLLHREADNSHRKLYENNKAVYNLLRYGVPVKVEAGKVTETVHLINWHDPHQNDFAVAEEVTLRGPHERRPDVVLYVNGIAIGVLELKNSRASIGNGIRQNLSNQQPEFNAWFFSTVQFIFAGNDSEGLKYGTINTQDKYFLNWKEDEEDNTGYKLDKYLRKLCEKGRLIELMRDFVLFDGRKKLPRPHQYFAIKAAQEYVRRQQGGIIWHTQGSGKSIVMVLLAKWILENNPHARVVIITDRDELDKQIERVFHDSGETDIKRTRSGRELMKFLGQARPRLLTSLVHKFGRKDVDDFDAYIQEIEASPSHTYGEVFVFVDECHRTQSGKLNRAMKALMPNAVLIGFTGTPLLKKDKQTTFEVFGSYIHTYKFSEGVEDGVILDLVYEARDINQRLTSQESVDEWFELVSKGLNDWQKDELKKQWGTMQAVRSSESRMRKVIQDIIMDFRRRPRLSEGTGNALLVASSIYEATRYYSLFQSTPFRGRCAVVTSYNPHTSHITLEETGANTETDKQFIYNTYTELLENVQVKGGMSKTEAYEEMAKKDFTENPANMSLLIVVDKLLTGFDAPPCTYLYIDKSMQDHGLFQAICRVNRLDGETKTFGYIVDYMNLFPKVENALAVYTSELDDSAPGADPEVLVQDRLSKSRERLDNAIETLALLCEPVEHPRDDLAHIHYFCGNTEIADDLDAHQPQRVALYRAIAVLVRSYANLIDEMIPAGYSADDSARIKRQVNHYVNLREIIRKASDETLDLKPFEADMRHLIDTYIEADAPRTISQFEDMGLLELIEKLGIAEATDTQLGELKGDETAIAEVIENNVRSKIIREHLNDPAFYAKMSTLLDEIIANRKSKAIEYEEYLQQIGELATKVQQGRENNTPVQLNSPGKLALYNNLKETAAKVAEEKGLYKTSEDPALDLALAIDAVVLENRYDGFRGVEAKERMIKKAIYQIIEDTDEVERIFKIIAAPRNGY